MPKCLSGKTVPPEKPWRKASMKKEHGGVPFNTVAPSSTWTGPRQIVFGDAFLFLWDSMVMHLQ